MLRVRAELAKLTTVADAGRRDDERRDDDSMSGKGERIWKVIDVMSLYPRT